MKKDNIVKIFYIENNDLKFVEVEKEVEEIAHENILDDFVTFPIGTSEEEAKKGFEDNKKIIDYINKKFNVNFDVDQYALTEQNLFPEMSKEDFDKFLEFHNIDIEEIKR